MCNCNTIIILHCNNSLISNYPSKLGFGFVSINQDTIQVHSYIWLLDLFSLLIQNWLLTTFFFLKNDFLRRSETLSSRMAYHIQFLWLFPLSSLPLISLYSCLCCKMKIRSKVLVRLDWTFLAKIPLSATLYFLLYHIMRHITSVFPPFSDSVFAYLVRIVNATSVHKGVCISFPIRYSFMG